MPSVARIRRSLRALRRTPTFTLVTVVTLGVAIGANSAVFSVVNGVLLRPLPYPESERLVVVGHTAPSQGFDEIPQSTGTYVLERERSETLEELGMYWDGTVNLSGEGEPERISAAGATHSLFSVLRAAPALGRGFTEEDQHPDAEPVAILSHGLWQRRFGGDPGALGRTLVVDGETVRVVGVLPAGFDLPYDEDVELWLPFELDRSELTTGNFSYTGIGRLRPGASIEAARADLGRLVAMIPDVYPDDFITREMMEEIGFAIRVEPLIEDVTGDVSRALWILLGTVGMVLLIACANVANLFLVRAEGRQKEIAVRSALGAERGALARHFLGESLALSALGGLLGLVLAWGGVRLLLALGPEGLPRLASIRLDGTVLAFTAGVAVLAGLLFGVAPVFRYTRPNLSTTLKEGTRGTTVGRERLRARTVLVLSQVALAFLLLVGSGLMVRSFWNLRQVDPGFRAEDVLTLRLSLPETEYDDAAVAAGFYRRLLDRVAALPGVEAVGAASKLPLRGPGESHSGLVIEDRPVEPGRMPHVELSIRVLPGYFETMGIPLLAGRTIEPADVADATGAVVVSRSFAEKYWPGESAVGKRVFPGIAEEMPDSAEVWWTVVGVVGDTRNLSLEEEIRPEVYYAPTGPPPRDYAWRTMSLVVRTAASPTALAPQVRDAVWALDPNVPIANVETMGRVLRDATSRAEFTMLMLGIAALVALLLGSIGIYGVISYGVSQRRQEIGVRMALGAEASAVSGMVVRQGAVVAGIGLGIGLAAAFGLTRLMDAMLFEVSPTDPPTFGIGLALLFGVALLASWVPARRAAGTDPAIALRAE